MKRIIIEHHGGPEVLRLVDESAPQPGPGEALIRQAAVGVNFIDVYFRTGLYPLELPSGLGQDAVGIVEALGPGVKDFSVGDRVGYGTAGVGAYAEYRAVAADKLIPLPDGVTDEVAAATLVKGMSTEMLIRQVHEATAGEDILVYAAAGGVGTLLCQWAAHLGARVLGVVGAEAKAAVARENGCAEVLIQRELSADAVRDLAGGAGVHVVYDSVGADTFWISLDSLRPRGLMVSYGNASGPPPAVSPLELSKRGSLFLTRPTLFHYVETPDRLRAAASAFFEQISSGVITPRIGGVYPLAEAAQAHRDLEARKTTGAIILKP
ncbi:MAG: quinone oxidoreductase [Parvularculaceae bacterium]